MGKFYEMFEMDAHIGAKELDLQYMKVCILLITPICIVDFDRNILNIATSSMNL